jgi:glycosyltransferase involved in cell wall biosynthesis
MRVAHIVDRLGSVGGVRTYLEVVLPALARHDVEGVVVTADPGEAEFAGAEVVVVPGIEADGPALPGATLDRLSAALAATRPDAVYLHVASSPAVARTAAASARRMIAYAHDYGMVCPGNARFLHASARFCAAGPGLRCFTRAYTERCTNRRPDRVLRAYRRARAWESLLPDLPAVLVASPFVARQLEAAGAPAESVKIVPCPIQETPVQREAEPATDVLFVGRLIASKGAEVLLGALAILGAATAVIAGDGPDRPALESLASRLGLDGRVRFAGWVDPGERLELFRTSRVLAFPALWEEPFGLVGLEALAAGLPVVASDAGGIPAWLTEGEGGLLVPPGDPARLASALQAVLGDDAERERLSACGPTVAARFSVERHLELLLPELDAA